jgi:hypothetical protein
MDALDEILRESEKTARLAATHAPRGHGGKNYVTESKPGNRGQYPAYFQQVRNAMVRAGKTMAEASKATWGALRRWRRGGGGVSPEVKAAATKALAELEAIGAAAKLKESATDFAPPKTVDEVLDRARLMGFGRFYA